MPWIGNYYYRSKRVDGRPRKIYVGPGLVGKLAAEEDCQARLKRAHDKASIEAFQAENVRMDAMLDEVHQLADVLGRVALYAAGYRQHCKGDWRRTRVRN